MMNYPDLLKKNNDKDKKHEKRVLTAWSNEDKSSGDDSDKEEE